MVRIGLLAGAGSLPVLFCDAARSRGDKVVCVGIKGITDPVLETRADKFIWFEMGGVQKLALSLVADRIGKVVLLGKFRKDLIFKSDEALDADSKVLLGKLGDRRDYSILKKAEEFLKKLRIDIMDPTPYLGDIIPRKGQLSARAPSKDEAADIEYAVSVARQLAGLDIGQAVAVRQGTVIAVEGVEGTDEMIARAGALSQKGFVLAKVARPAQDMRFDVPLVGLETVEALAKAGGTALALEADRTYLMDRQAVVKVADQKNLSIVIV